jgi:hypothetical protein
MPVTANADALTTKEAFLAYMGEPTDQSGAAADRAQRYINGYSRAALKYLRRRWTVETATDKIFYYSGNGFLSLAPFEARTIHTVTLYTDMPTSGWQVLANQSATQEAQWRARPANRSEQGTYLYMTLPEIGPYHPYYDEPITTLNRRNLGYEVTVNADWGVTQSDVPDDIELAIWIACANAWRNPEAYQTRHMGPLMATDYAEPAETEGLSLPRASRALLHPYRRRTGVR